MEISLKINGKDVKANVKPNTLLSTFIRENLNLTGTHIGCDTSQCGACAIHLNGLHMHHIVTYHNLCEFLLILNSHV